MHPEILKVIHVGSVSVSFGLFFLRGWWMLHDAPHLRQRWVRIAPHLVDTVLLTSAIALAASLGYSPLDTPWLAAKIAALLVYIGLGTVALKRGRSRSIRLSAWLAALTVFLYIASVAVCHTPAPWQCLQVPAN
jgi:uncharacterized membrane protein SirB2